MNISTQSAAFCCCRFLGMVDVLQLHKLCQSQDDGKSLENCVSCQSLYVLRRQRLISQTLGKSLREDLSNSLCLLCTGLSSALGGDGREPGHGVIDCHRPTTGFCVISCSIL